MIRIAIADDHQLFAEGLSDALDALPDMRVVFVAGNTESLLSQLKRQPADVVLLDLEMPSGGGLEALPELTDHKVVVVSMHVEDSIIKEAFDLGASGVLSKATPLTDLAASVRAVNDGEQLPVDPNERSVLLDNHRKALLDPGAAALTEREVELLSLLASGISSTEELAEHLFISQKTVKNHLASIFQKLSVSDRTQAAIEAIRLGLAKGRSQSRGEQSK